jgi:hypothetical protein
VKAILAMACLLLCGMGLRSAPHAQTVGLPSVTDVAGALDDLTARTAAGFARPERTRPFFEKHLKQ